MEEKNMSAQLEDDEVLVEEELDEEEIDEAFDEDPDEEELDDEAEYDFNDEDEDTDDSDEDGEAVESTENTEPDEEASDKTDEPTAEEKTESTAEQTEPTEKEREMQETMAKLLDRLGYHGTYEEAMAAYEADEAKRAEEKPAEDTPAKDTSVNYAEMASNSLRDINAAFGTSYTDFSQFDDLHRFAELMMGGATALEAYRATQKQFRSPPAEAIADSDPVGKPSKDHLKTLPKAGAGETGVSHSDRQALAALRELYPERSVKDLKKTLDRVKRARA